MKKLIRIIAAIVLAGIMHSCTESCKCQKLCCSYKNDSVTICLGVYGDYYYRMADSLTSLYGAATDSVNTTYYDLPSGKLNQYEGQGYYCLCAK